MFTSEFNKIGEGYASGAITPVYTCSTSEVHDILEVTNFIHAAGAFVDGLKRNDIIRF